MKRVAAVLLFIGLILVTNLNQAFAPASEIMTDVLLKDLQAIQTELNVVSLKIESALKTNLVLYSAMKKQMQFIMQLKDTAQQRLELAKYRTTYLAQYGTMVKKAGVDMPTLVTSLNQKFPKFSFSIVNSFGISARFKSLKPVNPSTGAASCEKIEPITGFLSSKSQDCALIGGSDVTFGLRSIHAFAGGSLAGGCKAEGILNKTITLPAGSCSIHIKYALEYKTRVMGIAGAASTWPVAWLSVRDSQDQLLLFSIKSDPIAAMVLWYVDKNEYEEFDKVVPLSGVTAVNIELLADANFFAVAGGAATCHALPAITKIELIRN